MSREAAAVATLRPADFVELAKPRITLMVALTAGAGIALGSGESIDALRLAHTMTGTALLAAGASALNQVIERQSDGLMRRTADRPLPTGRMPSDLALLFGALLAFTGMLQLTLAVNALTALLGAATLAAYVFVYTPLKRVTSLATVIGAIPGATPPMMGWAGARGEVELGAWVLFALLFLWQLPHFLAIAWLYRADYERAGMPMLSVVDPEGGRVGRQALLYAAALLPVSLMPSALGLAGGFYALGALLLGLGFVGTSGAFAFDRTPLSARRLLLFSVLYLPAVLVVLMLDRVGVPR
jgi:protoheme IX farnesyltransferase